MGLPLQPAVRGRGDSREQPPPRREESERLLAEARKSAERIHADAAAAIDQELQRARRELRAEASDLALKLAAEILRERVGESDRERLADEFITRIEASSHDGTGMPGPRHAGSEERRG